MKAIAIASLAMLLRATAALAQDDCLVPFLEKQLAGDQRFASFLVPPAPPGIMLQSQP
jgi:hypothetical protein